MAGRADAHRCAQAVAVRRDAIEQNLEPVDRPALRQITDQDLRFGVEVVSDQVQVAIVVKVEEYGGAAADSSHHSELTCPAFAILRLLVRAGTIQVEPGSVGAPIP